MSPRDFMTELGRALGCTAPAPLGSGQRSAVSGQLAESRKLKAESCLSQREIREREYMQWRYELDLEHYQGRFKVANRARSRAKRERRRLA